jgi:hypothetical protein
MASSSHFQNSDEAFKGTSFRPARAASQTVIKKARVGNGPSSKLRLNYDMAVLSPTLEEYTIQSVSGAWPGSPDGTTVFPQQRKVDYIRVYQ